MIVHRDMLLREARRRIDEAVRAALPEMLREAGCRTDAATVAAVMACRDAQLQAVAEQYVADELRNWLQETDVSGLQ